MDQLDLFGLMPSEEANQYKPQVAKRTVGTTASAVQHAKEKEASSSGATVSSSKVSSFGKTGSNKVSDKSLEYLNYMKIFCWSAHYFIIKDRSLPMEGVRKEMVKRFPELSRERTTMNYTPPKVAKGKKTVSGQAVGNDENEADTCVTESEACSEEDALNEGTTSNEGEVVDSLSTEMAAAQTSIPELEDPLISSLDNFEEIEPHLLQTVIKALGPHGMIIPDVSGGKRGASSDTKEASWIRRYSNWDDLLKRPAVCNHLEATDGLYEVRISKVGLYSVRLNDEMFPNGAHVKEGVRLFMPPIPADLALAVRDFFIELAAGPKPVEGLVRFYWDGQRYFAHVPHQVVTKDEVLPLNHQDDVLMEAKYTKVLELHSHNTSDAFFSTDDNNAETFSTGIFGVWGNLDRLVEKQLSFRCRISVGGKFHEINPFDIIDAKSIAPRHLPTDAERQIWHWNVSLAGGEADAL